MTPPSSMDDVFCNWCGEYAIGFYLILDNSQNLAGRVYPFCRICEPASPVVEIEIIPNDEALRIYAVQNILDQ